MRITKVTTKTGDAGQTSLGTGQIVKKDHPRVNVLGEFDHLNSIIGWAVSVCPSDQLTLDFAEALLRAEKLGQDATPDYLAVSFSSTDYVGHFFGPSSLEMEDNMIQLDRTLAKLFSLVDQQVGLAVEQD